MFISDERIGALAKTITDTLLRERYITVTDPQLPLQAVRRAMAKYIQVEALMDQRVRAKIASLKRGVPEGSREWDILYQKYYEEELNKGA